MPIYYISDPDTTFESSSNIFIMFILHYDKIILSLGSFLQVAAS